MPHFRERERERERRAPTIFTLPKLLHAYRSCRKRKRTTINALKFELDLETNLLDLRKQLENHTYWPKRSVCFIVTYPKVREIFAADFSDRIIHHLLITEIEPYFEKIFIHNSFACRTNKGTHAAVDKLRQSIRKITKNNTQTAYYGHFDIKSFFTLIDRQILYDILESRIIKIPKPNWWKKEILFLTDLICFQDPTDDYYLKGNKKLFDILPIQKSLFGNPNGKGLPIGNLTSQFFANVYLNPLDQHTKRDLKIKHYFRYVDDIIVLSNDKSEIYRWQKQIQRFLTKRLQSSLHPDKTRIQSIRRGIDFLGYFIKPTHTLVRRRVVKTLKSKLYQFTQYPNRQNLDEQLAIINSYFAHFRHAKSYRLRQSIYHTHIPSLKDKTNPQNNLTSLRPRKPTR